VKQAEPRFCVVCGVNRRAKPGGQRCYGCMSGGPFNPPPCRRCGATDDFFASELCARCHLHGSIRVGSCLDCHAWGATRTTKWLCVGCANWRRLHRTADACASCSHTVAVNDRRICRLCWKNATGHRLSGGGFDPIGPNRHGQQLFFARMQRAAALRPHARARRAAPPWPPGRPVQHRQLVLFALPHDLSRGRGPLPEPSDGELAAALEWVTTEHARAAGWNRSMATKVRCGIRTLLGLQDTPGAPIRYSEMLVLPPLNITIRPIIEVLQPLGMFEDDRTPAIIRWFSRQIAGLPTAMVTEVTSWFEIMRNGSATAPRRRARSETTIKLYTRHIVDAGRLWASGGHESLREVTRSMVLAALSGEPVQRKLGGQALRSLFGILKERRLVFTNPAVRLNHGLDSPLPPPAVDLEALREALNSPDPARAAIAALVAYHALASRHLRDLRLTDIRDRRLHIDRRVIPLAEPVRRRVQSWLDHRSRRWPTSTNPHLFLHFRTAAHLGPVGNRWVFLTLGLRGGVQAIRADRILQEAIATAGDPRRLVDLFGLSIQHATRYTDAIAEPMLDG